MQTGGAIEKRKYRGIIPEKTKIGALIFRDHGKRTENTEMAFGNGKCNFKRKITENHFSAGKNNKIHKIYKISQTK